VFAIAGRFVWWAAGLFLVSLLLFIYFRSGPRLYSGPSTSIGDLKEIITGIGTVLGAVVAIMGFADRWFFKTSEGQLSEDKRSTENRGRQRNRPVIGQEREQVIAYEDDYEIVSIQTFAGYNAQGLERWELGDEFRRRRRDR
jgi:hypothetical protein